MQLWQIISPLIPSYCHLRFIQTSFRNTDCKYILNKHLDLSECGSSTIEEQVAEKISGTCAIFLPSYLRLLHVNIRQLLIKINHETPGGEDVWVFEALQ